MVRLDDEQLRSLDAMAEATGIPASTLAHNAVTALLHAFSEHGYITSPLRLKVVHNPPRDAARDFSVNENDGSLLSRMQAVLQEEAAKQGVSVFVPPHE